MAKTYVQRIAEVVARRHNLSMKDAEAFVAAMFVVAHEGMEQDKQVKIKGLGTFKVVAVKSRESVNVNTGERIVLEGHDKVSFTPDTAMKELVNKPFAQFEAVVLNDGVDLETVDQQKSENSIAEQVLEEQEAPEQEVQEPVAEEKQVVGEDVKEELVAEDEQIVEEVPTDESVMEDDSLAESVSNSLEATSEEATLPIVDNSVSSVAEATKSAESENEETPVTPTPAAESEKEPTHEDSDESNSHEPVTEEETRASHRRIWALLILGMLIVAAVAGYFWYNQKQNEQPLPPLPKSMTERPKAVAKKAVAQKPQTPKDTLADDLTRANQDPRVRIGGYDIVGVDTVITLRGSQTMHSYCKHTLGKDMIVYFQALNGKDSMVAGEHMKVPKVKFRTRN